MTGALSTNWRSRSETRRLGFLRPATELDSAIPSGAAVGPGCPSCGTAIDEAGPTYVYALGRIEPRFPTLALEKEFAQATGRSDLAGLSDSEALREVLVQRPNRYLLRQMCWVLRIEGLETYILQPRDPLDYELLVEALRPVPKRDDVDVVIGTVGPIAPPELCNGLALPVVAFDQVYSFDTETLIGSIPRPEGIEAERFEPVAYEVFAQLSQLADNAGAMDEHRVLNYLAVRYHAVYATTTERHAANDSLSAVDVRPSRLSGPRRIYDVVFSYTNRTTDVVTKFFVRVDATEQFPFLVTKMSPYYDR
jgi:hypothetical protein